MCFGAHLSAMCLQARRIERYLLRPRPCSAAGCLPAAGLLHRVRGGFKDIIMSRSPSYSSPRKHAPLSALKCHKSEEVEAVQGQAQHCCLRSTLSEESRHVAASRCSEHCTYPSLALSARLVDLRREHGRLGTVFCQTSSSVLSPTNMGCSGTCAYNAGGSGDLDLWSLLMRGMQRMQRGTLTAQSLEAGR